MGFILPMLALGAAKIGGELLKKKDEGVPSWLIDDLRGYAADNRQSGYLPDKGVYDAALQTQLDEFTAGLPMSMENFNTDLASRGLYSAGEAPKALYSDVIAPVARAGSRAITESNLGYAQAYQQGTMFGDEMELKKKQLLIQAIMNKTPSSGGIIGNILSGGADLGIEYLMMKSLTGGSTTTTETPTGGGG